MIPLNYHHLYYFYVVAREGSIAKAKDKLLLSQPTISAQLRELEAQLGRPLFERRHQRLHLTESGRVALDYAERIFDLGGELQDHMGDRPVRAALRAQIGVIAGLPAAIYEALASFLYEAFPGARLSFSMKEASALARELRDHRLDLVVSEAPLVEEPGEELASRLAGRVPVILAAAPEVARRLGSRPPDGFPAVLPGAAWRLRRQTLKALARAKVVGETDDLELAWRLGIAGHGVVAVDRRTLAALKGAMVPVGFGARAGLSLAVYLTTRRRRWPNPLAERALGSFRL